MKNFYLSVVYKTRIINRASFKYKCNKERYRSSPAISHVYIIYVISFTFCFIKWKSAPTVLYIKMINTIYSCENWSRANLWDIEDFPTLTSPTKTIFNFLYFSPIVNKFFWDLICSLWSMIKFVFIFDDLFPIINNKNKNLWVNISNH